MRIAVVTWSRRRVGGVESYLQAVCAELLGRGHDLAFWHEVDAPADRAAIALPGGVPSWCAADLGAGPSLEALRCWRPDVVYAHGLQSPALEAGTLAAAPAVLFVHNYYGTCISGTKAFGLPVARPCGRRFGPACLLHYLPRRCGGKSPLTMWRLYALQRDRLALMPRYRAVVTHSEHMRRECRNHGVAAECVASYTNLPDAERPAPHRFPLPAAGDDPVGPARLLFLGRMDRLKGGAVLLEALPRVAAALGRPVRLTFAGDGHARADWEARAAKARGPGVEVAFAGWVGREAREELFAGHDLLVVPSQWPEPYGLVGIEAAAAGLPAAAFDVGGVRDWLRDGVNGALAPGDPPTAAGLADAVVRCLHDPIAFARLRGGAARVAAETSMARHLDSLEGILGRVAGAPREVSV